MIDLLDIRYVVDPSDAVIEIRGAAHPLLFRDDEESESPMPIYYKRVEVRVNGELCTYSLTRDGRVEFRNADGDVVATVS